MTTPHPLSSLHRGHVTGPQLPSVSSGATKQDVHVRIPSGLRFGAQLPQTTLPQARQWWRRLIQENLVSQTQHAVTSASAIQGPSSPRSPLSTVLKENTARIRSGVLSERLRSRAGTSSSTGTGPVSCFGVRRVDTSSASAGVASGAADLWRDENG